MPLPYSADQPPSEARMTPLMLVPSSLSKNVMEAASCAAEARQSDHDGSFGK
jgi:hypothetical protein